MINILFLFIILGNGHAFYEPMDDSGSVDVDVSNTALIQDIPEGYELLWSDEFNLDGKPDEKYWIYEEGFVRNEELQWYKKENASIKDGVLYLEGKREIVPNDRYEEGNRSWRQNREFAEYTSACIKTRDKFSFQYGILEVRARIDTNIGLWPAIWTLGTDRRWPSCGEVDVMEYYRIKGEPTILANAAWVRSASDNRAVWNSVKIPYSTFTENEMDWHEKFHIWKMEWTEDHIKLYLDDQLLNETDLAQTANTDGFNPFKQPHYILLNLAIGANGGDPSGTEMPKYYLVDYVRVYQKK